MLTSIQFNQTNLCYHIHIFFKIIISYITYTSIYNFTLAKYTQSYIHIFKNHFKNIHIIYSKRPNTLSIFTYILYSHHK
ncbi:hypothetical protein F383_02546 [Gossypium arboreum]|uniref:Uncharacterized protein n=1 Tax=Gossypium arboreum TaxID=29729 RepID=A0A0B0NLX0_GOSAR|nr:hypothetical protein F383_02546 [Gossypium arboreum]